MRIRVLLILSALVINFLTPFDANAGGGCGLSIPTSSSTFVKPGESFHVDFAFIQNDSNIDYADPKIAPEVNFSSSLPFLQKRMQYIGLDANKWAQYRATFQIPPNFIGNQNLQSVLIYPACEGVFRAITYGPYVTIQSSPTIPTCVIEDLQVTDYSVKVGEKFKVGFKVYSPIQNLEPTIELTDSLQKITIPARLAGFSGTDLKVYEATLSYTQAYQFTYSAIARAVVENLCNSSGQRQVIGINSYVTSMSILQPIYPNFPCDAQGTSINTKTNQLIEEELLCTQNPDRGNTLTWMPNTTVPKNENLESCTKLYSVRKVGSNTYFCIYKTGKLFWFLESKISIAEWREATAVQNAKAKSLYSLIIKAKKSNPDISVQLDNLWKNHNESVAAIPESIRDTFEEFIYANGQTDKFLSEYFSLTKVASAKQAAKQERISITCVKGKTTKKITGTSPKCPSGYRKSN